MLIPYSPSAVWIASVGRWLRPRCLEERPPHGGLPITRATVAGALFGLPAPATAASVAAALTLAPEGRHVRRAADCCAALVRRGLVPEELVDAS